MPIPKEEFEKKRNPIEILKENPDSAYSFAELMELTGLTSGGVYFWLQKYRNEVERKWINGKLHYIHRPQGGKSNG